MREHKHSPFWCGVGPMGLRQAQPASDSPSSYIRYRVPAATSGSGVRGMQIDIIITSEISQMLACLIDTRPGIAHVV